MLKHSNAKEKVETILTIHEIVRKDIEETNETHKLQHNNGVRGSNGFEVGNLILVCLNKEIKANVKRCMSNQNHF